jgi:hypothetical protein
MNEWPHRWAGTCCWINVMSKWLYSITCDVIRTLRNYWINQQNGMTLSKLPILLHLTLVRRFRKIAKRDYWLRHVCLSVRPSARPPARPPARHTRMEQLRSHWTDSHEPFAKRPQMLKEVVDVLLIRCNFLYPDMFRHMVAILRRSWMPDKRLKQCSVLWVCTDYDPSRVARASWNHDALATRDGS